MEHMIPVLSAAVHAAETELLFILIQIAAVILCARALGALALRIGQPRVVGEIVGGLALGPSLLGNLAPGVFAWLFESAEGSALYTFSQVGLILLMLQIGMEFDFSHLAERGNRRAVLAVTLGSISLPLAGGALLGRAMHRSLAPEIPVLHFVLFVAVALAVTALPILGRIMVDFRLTQTRLGSVTISAAALNDLVGWVLLAAITALTSAAFSVRGLGLQLLGIAVFGTVCWYVVRPVLVRVTARSLERNGELSPTLAALLTATALLGGVVTIKLGIFAIFGGFAVGVLLFDQRRLVEQWHRVVGPFVEFFFLPIFFTYTGLRTDAGSLDSFGLWGWCVAVILVATATKLVGSYSAARWARIPAGEARCLAVMMNTRALMELVVLNVGFDLGVIPPPVFTMLVFMAIATTMMTSPILRRGLPGLQLEAT